MATPLAGRDIAYPEHSGAVVAIVAEVKRMYTRPSSRGLGLAKALLRRIEDEARAAGAPVLRLETGIHQREAIGLY